jgi:hypothetical protein
MYPQLAGNSLRAESVPLSSYCADALGDLLVPDLPLHSSEYGKIEQGTAKGVTSSSRNSRGRGPASINSSKNYALVAIDKPIPSRISAAFKNAVADTNSYGGRGIAPRTRDRHLMAES